jgi:hypothetical protein
MFPPENETERHELAEHHTTQSPPHIVIAIMEAAIAGLIGASIGIVPSIVTYWLGRRSEERRHLREMIFKAAFEDWKLRNDRVRAEHPGHSTLPLDGYVIHAAHLIRQIDRTGRLEPAEARRLIRESLEVDHAAQKETEKFYEDKALES